MPCNINFGKQHKAHQNQHEPSHWPNSPWVWPPTSVWGNLAPPRTGSSMFPHGAPSHSSRGQNIFSHFVLAKVPFTVGQRQGEGELTLCDSCPSDIPTPRTAHVSHGSLKALTTTGMFECLCFICTNRWNGIETKMWPSWWQNSILLQRHEKWVRTTLLIRLLECRVVYHHFPIADEISRANGNSPTFSSSLRDLLKLIVEVSNHFQLILCH